MDHDERERVGREVAEHGTVSGLFGSAYLAAANLDLLKLMSNHGTIVGSSGSGKRRQTPPTERKATDAE